MTAADLQAMRAAARRMGAYSLERLASAAYDAYDDPWWYAAQAMRLVRLGWGWERIAPYVALSKNAQTPA